MEPESYKKMETCETCAYDSWRRKHPQAIYKERWCALHEFFNDRVGYCEDYSNRMEVPDGTV